MQPKEVANAFRTRTPNFGELKKRDFGREDVWNLGKMMEEMILGDGELIKE